MADSMSGTEVARLAGDTPDKVSRIRRRFAAEGLRGMCALDQETSRHHAPGRALER